MKTISVIKQVLLAIAICVALATTAQTTIYSGLRVPKVSASERLQIGAETNVENAKGQQIFNSSTGEMQYWDGSKWAPFLTNISTENGLTLSGTTLKLGGTLNQATTFNLSNNNLLFSRASGRIGIGTTSPQASLQIAFPAGDPLILKNVKLTSEAKNDADAANPAYYNLRISDAGVIRKADPQVTNLNASFTYNLGTNTSIAYGWNNGTGGSSLIWKKGGIVYNNIELPEDGAYVFSFRLYGSLPTTTGAGKANGYTYYISAFKNGTLFDIAEMVIFRSDYAAATYSIDMTVAGSAGDKITFKVADYNYGGWTLIANDQLIAGRTSMIFWKL